MKVPYYCGMRHKWGYGGNGIHADLRCLCFGMRVRVSLSPPKVIGYRLKPTQFLSECDITKTEPLTSVELWKTGYKEAECSIERGQLGSHEPNEKVNTAFPDYLYGVEVY